VVAVVHANGLTDEIARRAWWAMPVADNARRMLERECVVKGSMGSELAEYLIEYLPFETEHRAMVETIRLVLQPGLVDSDRREKLWRQAKRKNSYFVGFMAAAPDDLPEPGRARADAEQVNERLQTLVEAGNPVAMQLCRCVSEAGQTFLKTAEVVMRKPTNQDVVVEFLVAVQDYFSRVCPNNDPAADMQTIISDAEALLDVPAVCSTTTAVQEVLSTAPEYRQDVSAMLALSWVCEALMNPIFARTDAIGSVMRKKIEPVTTPIQQQFDQLLGKAGQ
jgi:hypothetical protein